MNTYPTMKIRPAAAPSPTGKEHSTASSMATGATEKPQNPSSEQMAASARACPGSWDTWEQAQVTESVATLAQGRWARRSQCWVQGPGSRVSAGITCRQHLA